MDIIKSNEINTTNLSDEELTKLLDDGKMKLSDRLRFDADTNIRLDALEHERNRIIIQSDPLYKYTSQYMEFMSDEYSVPERDYDTLLEAHVEFMIMVRDFVKAFRSSKTDKSYAEACVDLLDEIEDIVCTE